MNNLWLTVRRISVTIANLYSRKYFRIASDASSTEMFHQSQKTWLTERNSPRSRWWPIEMIGRYWIDWYLGSRNFEPCFRNRHAANNRNIFSVLRIGNGRTINWLYIKSLRRSLILKESMVFLEINVFLGGLSYSFHQKPTAMCQQHQPFRLSIDVERASSTSTGGEFSDRQAVICFKQLGFYTRLNILTSSS